MRITRNKRKMFIIMIFKKKNRNRKKMMDETIKNISLENLENGFFFYAVGFPITSQHSSFINSATIAEQKCPSFPNFIIATCQFNVIVNVKILILQQTRVRTMTLNDRVALMKLKKIGIFMERLWQL